MYGVQYNHRRKYWKYMVECITCFNALLGFNKNTTGRTYWKYFLQIKTRLKSVVTGGYNSARYGVIFLVLLGNIRKNTLQLIWGIYQKLTCVSISLHWSLCFHSMWLSVTGIIKKYGGKTPGEIYKSTGFIN